MDWVWYGEHVVFFVGGFSSVSASESECQQIRRFSIDSMCRNSQFTFSSFSLSLSSLSLSHTHSLSPSTTFSSIHPPIDLLPRRCVKSTPHHQPHRPDPEIHLDELGVIGPKQKPTIRSRNHDSSSAAPEKQKTRRQEQTFFQVFTSHLYHLEK